jgi:sucrose-6-phosphate hydrolase SacC (GH32 family)
VQVLARSIDEGRTFHSAGPPVLDRGRAESRDPFVFRTLGRWWMLLTEPCPWNAAGEERSKLLLFDSTDLGSWRLVQQIGPWSPAGVLWETPLLFQVRGGGHDWVLALSQVDRRNEATSCSTTYWTGAFSRAGFQLHPDQRTSGRPLDAGSDFYAPMVDTPARPGGRRRLLTAWLSSWAWARLGPARRWRGGAIAAPRSLSFVQGADGPQLAQRLAPAVRRAAGERLWTLNFDFQGDGLRIGSEAHDHGAIYMQAVRGGLQLSRQAGALPAWTRTIETSFTKRVASLEILIDGPLVELFCPAAPLTATFQTFLGGPWEPLRLSRS